MLNVKRACLGTTTTTDAAPLHTHGLKVFADSPALADDIRLDGEDDGVGNVWDLRLEPNLANGSLFAVVRLRETRLPNQRLLEVKTRSVVTDAGEGSSEAEEGWAKLGRVGSKHHFHSPSRYVNMPSTVVH